MANSRSEDGSAVEESSLEEIIASWLDDEPSSSAAPVVPPQAQGKALQQAQGIVALQQAHVALAAAPVGICWGSHVTGSPAACTPDFVPGLNHLKNKFCPSCRRSLVVPIERVKALTPELGASLSVASKLSVGFWKQAPPEFGAAVRLRVVNNTLGCTGPWVAIFSQPPPDLNVAWASLPPSWVRANGQVNFTISKGSLVPVPDEPTPAKRKRKSAAASSSTRSSDEHASSSANGSEMAEDDDAQGCLSQGSIQGGGQASSSSGVGVGSSSSSRFIDNYLDAQKRICRLIEEQLEAEDGMPDVQRGHLTAQLELSRALIAAQTAGQCADWRSQLRVTRSSTLGSRAADLTDAESTPSVLAQFRAPQAKKGCGAADDEATASSSRVLVVSAALGLPRARMEAQLCLAVLSSNGVLCAMADGPSAVELDLLLDGVGTLMIGAHVDAALHSPRGTAAWDTKSQGTGSLALQRAGLPELVDSEAFVRMVARRVQHCQQLGEHPAGLHTVLLNGCRSLHLALRLLHTGLPCAVCWETVVADEAAMYFGVAFARGLAKGDDVATAFDSGVSSVLTVTEPSDSGLAYVPKYALVSPDASGADKTTGRIPPGHPAAHRVAAGLPWLLRPLPARRLHAVPSLPAAYTPRRWLERPAIDVVAAHRLRAASRTPSEGATPRAVVPAVLVLLGPKECGKSSLAAWICRDLRTQSTFPDGIHWIDGAPTEQTPRGEPIPDLGRLHCLVVVDGATSSPQLRGSFEQLVIVTTCDPRVASAIGGGGVVLTLSALAPVASVVPAPPATVEADGRSAQAPALQAAKLVLAAGGGPAPLSYYDGKDEESFAWVLLLQLAVIVMFLAMVYQCWRPPPEPVLAGSSADADPLSARFEIVEWWVVAITPMPYLTMIAASPASQRLIFSLIELMLWWCLVILAINIYMSIGFASGNYSMSYLPAAADAAGSSTEAGSTSTANATGLARVEVPLASASAAAFHAYQAAVFVCWVLWALHMLRPRPGAPPFRTALANGMSRFKAVHGPVKGALLSAFGTSLPSSTYSYFLAEEDFFLLAVNQAYAAAWRGLTSAMLANAIGQAGLFAIIFATSGASSLAEENVWLLGAAALNTLCAFNSTHRKRRQVRMLLFPKQHQEATGIRV